MVKLSNQSTIAKSVEVSKIEEWKDGREERKEGFVLRFTTPFQEDKDRTYAPKIPTTSRHGFRLNQPGV